jgi:NACHT domain
MRQDEVVRDLAEGLHDTLAFATECSDLRQIEGATDVIREICRAVLEAASLIDEYAQLSFPGIILYVDGGSVLTTYVNSPGRITRSVISQDLTDRIKSCRSRLTDLTTKFDRTVAVETRMIMKEMRSEGITKRKHCTGNIYTADINLILEQIDLLDRLPREVEARYNAARCCHGDTRKDVIKSIIDWVLTEDDTKVFWLHSLAGMGKSTIATSVSCALDERRLLGGTFFFSRDQATRSNPDQLFSTIAFQMSSIHSSITSALCKAITLDLDIGRSTVVNQFQGLIKGPLCDTKDLGHPLVILLDALDECGSEKQRKDLFTIIRTEFATLPYFVKFVITSRPEADIRANLMSMDTIVKSFDLGTVESRLVNTDILAFVSARMVDIARSYELTIDWPGHERREALVQRAGHLFVWASTACDFIEDDQNDGPEMQLDLILRNSDISSLAVSPWTALDNLYLQVLQQSIPLNASKSRLDDVRLVLGTMIAAPDPLSLLDLAHVLNLRGTSQGNNASIILRKLHSVLIVPPTDNHIIRIIHPSFVDFITDRSRCVDTRFYIDLPSYRLHLAKSCLTRMQECLRRDICSLGTGQTMNKDIPDLDKWLAQSIPEYLQYACRYWAEYLQRSVIDEELYVLLREFISKHLLHWLEVMSLMGIYNDASTSLTSARVSLKVKACLIIVLHMSDDPCIKDICDPESRGWYGSAPRRRHPVYPAVPYSYHCKRHTNLYIRSCFLS